MRALLPQLAADLITVAVDDEGTLASRMARRFEWMLAVSDAGQASCAQNLVDAARAFFSTGQAHLALAELISSRETATAMTAGFAASPVEWLDLQAPVERP